MATGRHRHGGSIFGQYLRALPDARRVSAAAKKPVLNQVVEMARLWRLPNRISPDEYFTLRLFDDSRLSWADKNTFLGRRAKPHIYRFNDPGWRALAEDKLLCLAQLAAFGLPAATVVAVHGKDRTFPGAVALRTPGELGAFLRSASYPLFAKPTMGTLGRGAVALASYDAASDELGLSSGERVAVPVFVDRLSKQDDSTVFQELVRPHPETRRVCGDRLSTVRVLVLLGADGPILHRVVWRVPVGQNMVDNFSHGRLGNLLGAVSVSDGTVTRVIGSTGLAMREVDQHPDTGTAFHGVVLPDWQAVLETCRQAGAVMSGMRIQNWDVALSDRGPLLMEVNFRGDLDLTQMAGGIGVADPDWHRFMDACRRRR
jgi:hypothetical protein